MAIFDIILLILNANLLYSQSASVKIIIVFWNKIIILLMSKRKKYQENEI